MQNDAKWFIERLSPFRVMCSFDSVEKSFRTVLLEDISITNRENQFNQYYIIILTPEIVTSVHLRFLQGIQNF